METSAPDSISRRSALQRLGIGTLGLGLAALLGCDCDADECADLDLPLLTDEDVLSGSCGCSVSGAGQPPSLPDDTLEKLTVQADPTGLTDSAPAIQAAFDEAIASWEDPSKPNVRIIELPPGQFSIDTGLTVERNNKSDPNIVDNWLSIRGATGRGGTTTIRWFDSHDFSGTKKGATTQRSMLVVRNSSYVSIANVDFDGNRYHISRRDLLFPQKWTNSIDDKRKNLESLITDGNAPSSSTVCDYLIALDSWWNKGKSYWIQNCEDSFSHERYLFDSGHGIQINFSNYVHIASCAISDTWGSAVAIGSETENSAVAGCMFVRPRHAGVSMTNVRNVKISGCTGYACGHSFATVEPHNRWTLPTKLEAWQNKSVTPDIGAREVCVEKNTYSDTDGSLPDSLRLHSPGVAALSSQIPTEWLARQSNPLYLDVSDPVASSVTVGANGLRESARVLEAPQGKWGLLGYFELPSSGPSRLPKPLTMSGRGATVFAAIAQRRLESSPVSISGADFNELEHPAPLCPVAPPEVEQMISYTQLTPYVDVYDVHFCRNVVEIADYSWIANLTGRLVKFEWNKISYHSQASQPAGSIYCPRMAIPTLFSRDECATGPKSPVASSSSDTTPTNTTLPVDSADMANDYSRLILRENRLYLPPSEKPKSSNGAFLVGSGWESISITRNEMNVAGGLVLVELGSKFMASLEVSENKVSVGTKAGTPTTSATPTTFDDAYGFVQIKSAAQRYGCSATGGQSKPGGLACDSGSGFVVRVNHAPRSGPTVSVNCNDLSFSNGGGLTLKSTG